MGGSRAAQRREKKRQQAGKPQKAPQTQQSQQEQQKQQQKKQQKLAALASDSDSDSDGGDHVLVPLPSLEQGRIRDFEAEQRASSSSGKRARAEKAQLAIDQRKKRYREDKAEKIVWRKFDRENEPFERFYQRFLQLDADEWKRFRASLKDPVPVHVRVNGNYRSLREIVAGTLATDFDIHDMPIKLPSGDEVLVDFSPVSWAENIDSERPTAWKLSLDSKALRKSELLRDLSKYFDTQTRLGSLLRHEPAADILPVFLDPGRGDKVLDLCGGGEHRAPMIMQLMSKTASDEDEDMDGNESSPSTVLVVNEKDAASAANAVRALSRSLALSSEVVVTANKPLEFPLPLTNDKTEALFDRVVCCAPCSRDGMVRQLPELWRTWRPSDAFQFHTSQLHLLSRALELVKVGGRVVYSTRSLHPLENEAVVAEMLRRYTSGDEGCALELVDVSEVFPQLRRSDGKSNWEVLVSSAADDKEWEPVESWETTTEDQRRALRPTMFQPSESERNEMHLDRCMRVLPHLNDTHGLFIAVIAKVREVSSAVPSVAGPAAPAPANEGKKTNKASKSANKQLGGYSSMSADKTERLSEIFGLGLPNTHAVLMERSGLAKENRSVHLVTPGVADLIDRGYSSGRRLAIHRAGVTAMTRSNASSASNEEFELTDDGARALLPLIRDESRRVLSLEMAEFSSLLASKQMWLKHASENARIALDRMTEGSLVVVLDDMEPAQTGDRDLVLVAHKRHNSYSLGSSIAAIARVKALLAELHAEVDDSDEESDGDGYESFDE